jgi:predicted ATPase with chaperone activity
MDHPTRAVLAQADVDDTTNEIAGFQPLLDRLDLAATVVTADALSRHRHKASYAEVVVMPRWRVVALVWG